MPMRRMMDKIKSGERGNYSNLIQNLQVHKNTKDNLSDEPINMEDILISIKKTSPSIDESKLSKYRKWEADSGVI